MLTLTEGFAAVTLSGVFGLFLVTTTLVACLTLVLGPYLRRLRRGISRFVRRRVAALRRKHRFYIIAEAHRHGALLSESYNMAEVDESIHDLDPDQTSQT